MPIEGRGRKGTISNVWDVNREQEASWIMGSGRRQSADAQVPGAEPGRARGSRGSPRGPTGGVAAAVAGQHNGAPPTGAPVQFRGPVPRSPRPLRLSPQGRHRLVHPNPGFQCRGCGRRHRDHGSALPQRRPLPLRKRKRLLVPRDRAGPPLRLGGGGVRQSIRAQANRQRSLVRRYSRGDGAFRGPSGDQSQRSCSTPAAEQRRQLAGQVRAPRELPFPNPVPHVGDWEHPLVSRDTKVAGASGGAQQGSSSHRLRLWAKEGAGGTANRHSLAPPAPPAPGLRASLMHAYDGHQDCRLVLKTLHTLLGVYLFNRIV